jgi:hypothetical protein
MKFMRQPKRIEIQNFDRMCGQKTDRRRHGPLLPDTVRCLAVGASGLGKTNAIFNLLFHRNGLRFNNLYIFSKTLGQPKYELLKRIMHGLPKIGFFMHSDNDEVMHPSEARPHSVIVFDDISLERQNNVKNYFCFGRHHTIDCIYIAQSYASIGKHMVRDNANVVILFRVDDLNLKHVYSDHVGSDMTFDKFKEICATIWNSDDENRAFVTIVKDYPRDAGRYRKNFDTYMVDALREREGERERERERERLV